MMSADDALPLLQAVSARAATADAATRPMSFFMQSGPFR